MADDTPNLQRMPIPIAQRSHQVAPGPRQVLGGRRQVVQGEDADEEEATDTPERSAFDAKNLDDFLGQNHQETAVGASNGMPSFKWIKDNFRTKSAAIRYLTQQGYEPKQIAAHLGLKYQHVYNVAHQTLKRGPNEVFHDGQWQCSHDKASIIVDVIVRKGTRDPDASRVAYRVCAECAKGLIPGINDETIQRLLPGVKLTHEHHPK